MKIMVFSDGYFPQINGVVTQIDNMHSALVKEGHEVMVVAPSPDTKFREEKKHNSKIFLLPSIALPTYPDYRVTNITSGKIKKELKDFAPDIIHVHTPFSVGWLGLRYGRRMKIPVIGTYHTFFPEFLMYLPLPLIKKTTVAKKLTWNFTNHFYNKCTVVTTPTESMKKELEKNGTKNVVVLSNAIDFKRFNKYAKKTYSSKIPSVIYFGRIGFEKNIEILIFAVKHLLIKGINVKLSITGSGPALDYLKEIVASEKMGKNVAFNNPLSHDLLPKHVAKHDIFATASTIETQGLTILESMALGLPCVGANYLAIPDSIKENQNGFLFKPYDFVECANKIEKLLKSESLRKKLGKNAVKTAKNYSVEKVSVTTINLYEKASESA